MTKASQMTINFFDRNAIDTTNSVRAGPRPVWSTETPEGDDMSCKASSEGSSIRIYEAQVVNKQDSEGEKFETPNREDKASLTTNWNEQYHVKLSKIVTVQETALHEDMKDGTPTCREQMTGTTHIGVSKARNTSIGDLLTTHQNRKKDNSYQTPSE